MILDSLPWLAFVAGLAATVLAFWDRIDPERDLRIWRRRALWTMAALSGLTFLVLVLLFVLADVRYEYVFLYTRTDLALRFRIAGAWAGREGSLALWAMWTALVAAWVARRWDGLRERDLTVVITTGLATCFLGAVAWQQLFAPTPEWFLAQRPFGNGLNPTLRSDFFLIHPPMMFLAYALTNVSAAAALAHVWQGRGWSDGAFVARSNWILYTAAMGLGGVWAYYTLGFGGYWAWDPVEVANLLPWLALTVFLHARLHGERYGRFATVGPFLGLLPFLLTLFSTISTRSGLWISVHAFTDPTQTFNPDAPGRFLDIMGVEVALAFYVGLLLAAFFAFLGLWTRRLAADADALPRTSRIIGGVLLALAAYAAFAPASLLSLLSEVAHTATGGRTGIGLLALGLVAVLGAALPSFVHAPEPEKTRFDVKTMCYVSVLILGVGLLILWLWHMVAANGWATQFYEDRLPFLAAPAVLAITLFMLMPWGRKAAFWGAGIVAATGGLVGVIASAGIGLLASSILLMVAAGARTLHAATGTIRRHDLGNVLLVLGALLNLLFWINPPSTVLGAVGIQWPIQLLAIVALVALHRSFQHLIGRSTGRGATVVLVALLGGFYIAPLLAIIAWRLGAPDVVHRPKRMPQVGLFVVHFAVAVVLTGYAASTYLAHEESLTVDAASEPWSLDGVAQQLGPDGVENYRVVLAGPEGAMAAQLVWEPQNGGYLPLPATLRTWQGDYYASVDALCRSDCTGSDRLEAYAPTFQRPPGDFDRAEITLHELPGLGLVWLALVLFVYGAWLIAQSGISLSTKGST